MEELVIPPRHRFKSALVTGGTGFIGSALVRRLSAEGIRTYCLVRQNGRNSAWMNRLPHVIRIEIPSFEPGPLQQALQHVRAECVFHLAAYGVAQSERDPTQIAAVNIGALLNLLQLTASWPVSRFIHTGSCFEYAPPIHQQPMSEDHGLNSEALYGASKAAATLMGSALARSLALPFVVLRLFGVFGPGEEPNRLVPSLLSNLRSDRRLELTAGAQIRDLTHLDDVIEAYLSAANANALPTGVYNLSSGIPVTIREVAETIADCLGKPRELLGFGLKPYRSDEPMYLVGDPSKFIRHTGWRPRFDLKAGIQERVQSPT